MKRTTFTALIALTFISQSYAFFGLLDFNNFKIADYKHTYVDFSKIPQSMKDDPFRIPTLLELNEFIEWKLIGTSLSEFN